MAISQPFPPPPNIPPPPTIPPLTIGPPPGPTLAPGLLSPEYMDKLLTIPDNLQASASGVKIIGEIAALPGASLFAEGKIGQGSLFAALGILGGWAGGALFGLPGYILLRYGASAISFYESFATSPARPAAPTPPTNGGATAQTIQAVAQQQTRAFQELATYISNVANQLANHQQTVAQTLVTQNMQLRDTLAPSGRGQPSP
jgi:hypothetical protein